MLVMYHSMPKYKNITSTLLDFLIRAPDVYYPPLRQNIKNSIVQGFRAHQVKGVIRYVNLTVFHSEANTHLSRSLNTLFENPCLDPQLKEMLHAAFGEACLIDGENLKRENDESDYSIVSQSKEVVHVTQILTPESLGLKGIFFDCLRHQIETHGCFAPLHSELSVYGENPRVEPKPNSIIENRETEENYPMNSYEADPAVVKFISQILEFEDDLKEPWTQGQLHFIYKLASSSSPYQVSCFLS